MLRKKIISISCMLIILAILSLSFTGCNVMDATTVIEEMSNTLSNVKSFSTNLLINSDVNMVVDKTTVPFISKISTNMNLTTNPMATYLNGFMYTNILETESTYDLEAYSIFNTEEGTITTYQKGEEDDNWSKIETTDSENSSDGTLTSNFSKIISPLLNGEDCKYELDNKEHDINDYAVYLLNGTITGDSLKAVLQSIPSTNIDKILKDDYDFSKLSASIEMYVLKDSKLPAKISVDCTKAFQVIAKDSKNSNSKEISKYIPSAVNGLNLELNFSNFNKVPTITVPDDIISKAEVKDISVD